MSRVVLPSTDDPEMVEGVSELEAPARHPGMVVPLDGKRRIGRELFARLFDPPPGAIDDPGEDQRLSLGPAFGKTPLDEELIGPPLCGLRSDPRVKSAHRNFACGEGDGDADKWRTRSRA